MKTKHLITLIALLAALILTPFGAYASIKLESKIPPIEFFNKGEKPPLPPLMILSFPDLSPEKAKVVEKWKNEITEKIHALEPFSKEDTCKILMKIVSGFEDQFRASGVKIYAISWPREQTGGMIGLEFK